MSRSTASGNSSKSKSKSECDSDTDSMSQCESDSSGSQSESITVPLPSMLARLCNNNRCRCCLSREEIARESGLSFSQLLQWKECSCPHLWSQHPCLETLLGTASFIVPQSASASASANENENENGNENENANDESDSESDDRQSHSSKAHREIAQYQYLAVRNEYLFDGKTHRIVSHCHIPHETLIECATAHIVNHESDVIITDNDNDNDNDTHTHSSTHTHTHSVTRTRTRTRTHTHTHHCDNLQQGPVPESKH